MDAALAVFDAALPVVRYPSSGAQRALEPGQRRIVVARNGVFLEAMSVAVHACAPVCLQALGEGLGLGDAESFFRLRMGAIPGAIEEAICQRALRDSPEEWAGLVVVQNGRYELVEPRALSRSGGHIRYDSAGVDPLSVAFDVHSHGRGASYFSKTDDLDDAGNPSPCFAAGVIGNLGEGLSMQWARRAVVHGRFFGFRADGSLEVVDGRR